MDLPQKEHGLWICAVNRVDSRILKTPWIVDRGSAVILDADSGLCQSYVRTLGPKRNLDLRSFFRLDRCVNEFIQIISFFERSSFNLRCESVIGLVLCVVIQHVAFFLLFSLGEINIVIHMYQFTFEPLHLCFRMWLWFRI